MTPHCCCPTDTWCAATPRPDVSVRHRERWQHIATTFGRPLTELQLDELDELDELDDVSFARRHLPHLSAEELDEVRWALR
ncbi:MAG: hypothetical protein R2705_15775 [Ilumatobacteraceae bacterium]